MSRRARRAGILSEEAVRDRLERIASLDRRELDLIMRGELHPAPVELEELEESDWEKDARIADAIPKRKFNWKRGLTWPILVAVGIWLGYMVVHLVYFLVVAANKVSKM